MHRDWDNGRVCRVIGRCCPTGISGPENGTRLEGVRHAEALGEIIWIQDVVVVVPDTAGVEVSCYGGGDGVSGTGKC